MQKVTINGIMYLGELKEKDGSFTLKKAMQITTPTIGDVLFREYLKSDNLNILQDIRFGGQGTNYAIADLTSVEVMQLAMCKLGMEQAKKTAVHGLENDTFDNIMGK